MDPLSITASVIAVLKGVNGTGKGIGELISLRNAPAELLALSDEVETFRELLAIVRCGIRKIEGSAEYQDCRESLCYPLRKAERAALDLECTVEYQLRNGVEVDRDGRPKVSHVTWLKSSKKIQQLRDKIKDARDNLSTGLQGINLQIG